MYSRNFVRQYTGSGRKFNAHLCLGHHRSFPFIRSESKTCRELETVVFQLRSNEFAFETFFRKIVIIIIDITIFYQPRYKIIQRVEYHISIYEINIYIDF